MQIIAAADQCVAIEFWSINRSIVTKADEATFCREMTSISRDESQLVLATPVHARLHVKKWFKRR